VIRGLPVNYHFRPLGLVLGSLRSFSFSHVMHHPLSRPLAAVSAMKTMDPVSWRCAQADWEGEEESEENIISLDGGATYYRREELESFVESGAS